MKINTLFQEALLAQAAYVENLKPGMAGEELIDALKTRDGITQAQAEYFSEHFTVEQQDENLDTGFSATLFKNIETQKFHLAVRGSAAPGLDLDPDWTDANIDNLLYGISYDQVTDLINFYLRLTQGGADVAQFEFDEVAVALDSSPPEGGIFWGHEYDEGIDSDGDGVDDIIGDIYLTFKAIDSQPGLGVIANNQQLNVTGHSLGGHLASAFSLLYPSVINQTTTFNSGGIIGDRFDEFASAIAEVLGIVPHKVSNSDVNIIDIQSPLDPVSNPPVVSTKHLSGQLIDVFIEAEDTLIDLESHDMDRLVDSLAVMNLLNTLDSSFTLAKANELLLLASSDEYTELEGMMNYLAKLFGQDEVAITNSDHDEVYRTINQITDSLAGKTYQISTITDSIVTQALSGDKAALYAIVNLQPFVVKGTTQGITDALYQNHSANGALDIENISEQYLTERAAMLQWLIKYNETDEDYSNKLNPDDFPDTIGFEGNFEYTDLSSDVNNGQDLVLKIDGDGAVLTYEQIKFGTEDNDSNIVGGNKDDRLYGGGGNDNLLGQGGNDYLEGGKGNDTMSGGEDNDIYIIDSQDDVIVENADEGEADIIRTSVDYTLTEQDKYIEQIELDKTHDGSGLALTGNQYNNILVGNQLDNILLGEGGHNILFGGKGDDTLYAGKEGDFDRTDYDNGNLSNSTLYGGKGNDTYFISKGDSYEIIVDSDGQGEVYLAIDGIEDKSFKFTGGTFLSYEAQRDFSWSYSLNEYNERQAQGYYDYWLEFDDVTKAKAIEAGLHNTEGMPIGLFVESEGNYIITVGNALFQIHEFYQGDLGITLEQDADGQGYDLPERADLDDIIDAIVLDEAFDAAEVERIKDVFRKAYEQSPIARQMLTDFVSAGNAINIIFAENNFYSFVAGENHYASTPIGTNVAENIVQQQGDHIGIDLDWLDNGSYISTNGKAVGDNLTAALIHELVHFIKGFADTDTPLEKGETVTFANTIYKEMGIAEQASYHAYDPSGNSHILNFDYTQGQEIDGAFTLISEFENNNYFDSTNDGNLSHLIIGNERTNTLIGGKGKVYFYGNGGSDFLYGGEGADYLCGGLGNDWLYGGHDNDTYVFSKGDGQDFFQETEGVDTVSFTDIASSEVIVKYQSNGSLGVSFIGSDDQITVIEPTSNDASGLLGFEFFSFSDGVIWDSEMISTQALKGSDVDDVIYGDDGDNELNGLGGNDELYGRGGNDVLNGGIGDDLLSGDDGDDVYIFNVGSGNDKIIDDGGGDSIQFGEGITASDLHILYTAGKIVISLISDNAQADDQMTIRKTFPNDTIEKLIFSNGDTVLWDPIEQIYVSDDIDTEITDSDYNTIFSSGPESSLYGTDENDLFVGLDGTHRYYIDIGEGHDVIDDTAVYYSGKLVLERLADWQISAVQEGDDLVINVYGPLPQSIRILGQNSGLGLKEIRLPNQRITDPDTGQISYADIIYYADLGDREPYSHYGSYQVYRRDMSDLIRSPHEQGDDIPTIWGTYLPESIEGTDGDDIIDGGKGDDTIDGGSGNDTYIYNPGDGNDLLRPGDGSNTVKFGEISSQDTRRISIGGGWVRSLDGFLHGRFMVDVPEGQQVTIEAENVENLSFEFSDGVIWNAVDILSHSVVVGTDGDDIMDYQSLFSGTTFDMGLGDDTFYGGVGDDIYLYNVGDGQDTLSESSGTDKIIFGEGITIESLRITHDGTESHWIIELLDNNGDLTEDKITVENAYATYSNIANNRAGQHDGGLQSSFIIESFEFSDGTSMSLDEIQLASETLYTELEPEVVTEVEGTSGDDVLVGDEGVNIINGYDGNDTITGDLGNDTLIGGKGDDTYLYNLGDGSDTINDSKGADSLRFGAGISADNISVSTNDNDMLITLSDGQVITITDWYSADSSRIEQFEFADGTVWAVADILANMVVVGNDGDGYIYNKYLASGTTYEMGLGDDTVYGGKGDDTYLYNLGDGFDTINDFKGADSLRFGAGISADNINISANDSDMLITLPDSQVITITDWYSADSSRIEQFEFADGTVWAVADILANMVVAGNDGDGHIYNKYLASGTTYEMGLGDDTVYGGKGDDTYLYNLGDGSDTINDFKGADSLRFGAGISADDIGVSANDSDMLITLPDSQVITIIDWYSADNSRIEQLEFADGTVWAVADILANMVVAGNDGDGHIYNKYLASGITYEMGLGDDTVYGGKGDDTYLYNLGDGSDTINDFRGADSLRFGAGISADDISVSANDSDMLITLSDVQVITILDWYSADSSRIEEFEFADGTVWAVADILANMVVTGSGDEGNGDGHVYNKYLTSGTTYEMGLGDDTVYGGKGDDTYLYNLGDGSDTINDFKGADSLRFGAGISADDISVSANDSDMLITLSDVQVITILDWYSADSSRIVADQIPIVLFSKLFIEQFGNIWASFPRSHRTILAACQI